MTWVRALGLVVFVAACGGAPVEVTHRKQVDLDATRVAKHVFVASGRQAGTYVITTALDGTITTKLYIVENGRGPQVQSKLRVRADDWTLEAFEASGQHTMGTLVAERFQLANGVARWKSEEEQGEKAVQGAAFFLPIADGPISPFLVPAALKAGGTIALLPGGQAKVTKAGEVTVSAGSEQRVLDGYRIDGLGLAPQYAWFERGTGAWFGEMSSWSAFVPEGWEAAIAPITAKQRDLDRAREADIARLNATRPVSGIAFTNARVLDVEKGVWLPNQTVVVVGDTIKAVGKTGSVKIPDGVDTLPVEGMGIIPGLIDMHSHTGAVDGLLDIAAGVTLVRDVGNVPDDLDDLKARFDSGAAIGPHVVRYGFIEGRGPKAASSAITAETPDEAMLAVAEYKKRGYEGIKIYNSVKTDLVALLASEAHAKGMKVIGHVPVHMLAHEAVAAGFDGIEHINMLFLNFFATHETDTRDTTRFTLVGDKAADFDLASAPMTDFITVLRDKKIVIDPTLSAFEDLFVGVPGKVTPGLEATVARFPIQVQRGWLTGGLPMPGDKRALYARSWAKMLALVKLLAASKVPVVLGTDHIGGVMFHHEMELFVRAGLAPKDVLRMATIDSARVLGLDKTIGTIAAGKRADLVVVASDPLANIADIRKTVYTMRGGVLYRSDALYTAANVAP
ncbi:MAG: amidohydrolase family protein [Kofleriaceae bacterium]